VSEGNDIHIQFAPGKQTFSEQQIAEFARALIALVSHDVQQSQSALQAESPRAITLRLQVSVRFRENADRIRRPWCCVCFWSETERLPLCLGDCCGPG
jgi:hypothetical protein